MQELKLIEPTSQATLNTQRKRKRVKKKEKEIDREIYTIAVNYSNVFFFSCKICFAL